MYKHVGHVAVPGCTPAPMTMYDTRSCRERTGCTRECIPKKLVCDKCEKKTSSLNILQDIETGKRICICDECKEAISEEITYER